MKNSSKPLAGRVARKKSEDSKSTPSIILINFFYVSDEMFYDNRTIKLDVCWRRFSIQNWTTWKWLSTATLPKKCNYTLRELKFPSDATQRRSNDFNDNLLARRSASSRECIEQL